MLIARLLQAALYAFAEVGVGAIAPTLIGLLLDISSIDLTRGGHESPYTGTSVNCCPLRKSQRNACLAKLSLIPQPLFPRWEKGSRKPLSSLPLAHFWERGIKG